MRAFLIVACFLTLCYLATFGDVLLGTPPPPPVRTEYEADIFEPSFPIPAEAKFCGNRIVHGTRKTAAFEYLQAQGCESIHFQHVAGGYYLAWGTYVAIGE